jgi:glutaminyl-peptide cyclotransferase
MLLNGVCKAAFVSASVILICSACTSDDKPSTIYNDVKPSPSISYTIVDTLMHDTSAYTQGLEVYNGVLLEGTGNYGESELRKLDLKSGRAITTLPIDAKFFGEGITVLNDTLYQLTWKENVVHVYSAKDLKKIKEFRINTDGWGITNDSVHLIVSDGTSNLYYYEPSTFRLLRTQGVMEMGQRLEQLNELEYINGYVYANQYQFKNIYKIDPSSGLVVGKIVLNEIADNIKLTAPYADVLNGIAYDPEQKITYVTGKKWPWIYAIRFDQ